MQRTLEAARHRPDRAPGSISAASPSGASGGLLVLWDTVYDNLAVARQMGLRSPSRAAAATASSPALQHLQLHGAARQKSRSIDARGTAMIAATGPC